ncbi:MAG: glycosyl hydrolase 115 family protein [Pyrinomonadaceae bacterium]
MKRSIGRLISGLNHPLPQVVLTVLLAAGFVFSQQIAVKSVYSKGDFPLVHKGIAADIFYDPDDFKLVKIAANDLASDVERVTGKLPHLNPDRRTLSNAIIIGTLGQSPFVESFINNRKIDVTNIRGKRESFLIATISKPLPNVENALFIIGSDRRGTAFGVYELSQMIGVSPWYWWADATPERKDTISISPGKKVGNEPSVKYRGIFLNDEDWGLQPWAAKTFEPETGDIGPKTYAKIFELLLRLKANTLWPAMHEVTRPFNSIPANRQVADDYGIVMGSSHAEPMLRNNVGEWKANKDDFNFVTNPAGVTEYWEQRAKENGKYENVYTIGMRGIHDSPILGTKSQAERIPLLEKIFSVQRGLLSKYVRSDVENVSQIFCPYKEVLADYRAGLKVPDDVTIVFPDDNFGYIRQFPNAEERKRKGGFGVYYHISYLGRPLSYLWLNSTPPAQIWEEMSKAYENGMRNLWIVNVGDIKPGEIGMEFFLQMAYDAKKWTVENQHLYLKDWAKREFGEKHPDAIADVMDNYYRLGFQRKPEHLQWYLPTEAPKKSDLTEAETLERLEKYSDLTARVEALSKLISATDKDSFYEFIYYPVRSAALANERFFAAELANSYKEKWPKTALEFAKRSIAADAEIARETNNFNERLAGGKWRNMMTPEMGQGQWPSMRSTPPKISLIDFSGVGVQKPLPTEGPQAMPSNFPNSSSFFGEFLGSASIEAENFQVKADRSGFGWRIIQDLGKTGDSVSVFPNTARTFTDIRRDSPSLEYDIALGGGDYSIDFYMLPTQPLVPSNGLRIAFAIDGGEPQIAVVDKEIEVSSRKWAQNILDECTIGRVKISISEGEHKLRVFAVDTGVVLDKIVLSSGKLPESYFGPVETRFKRNTR